MHEALCEDLASRFTSRRQFFVSLSPEGVAASRLTCGANVLAKVAPPSFLSILKKHVLNPVILVLLACALVSLVLGLVLPAESYQVDCDCVVTESLNWVEGVAIVVAIAVVVIVSGLQDWDKERMFRQLADSEEKLCKVFRFGQLIQVSVEEVVVGDVVVLSVGGSVPADGFVFDGFGASFDESSLTGESEPVAKAHGDKVFSQTTVVTGECKMVVVWTGPETEFGRLALGSGQASAKMTPLEVSLNSLVLGLGRIGLFVAVVVFLVLYFFWAITVARLLPETAWQSLYLRGLVDALLLAITILVVVIPEGLPLTLTVALAYAIKSMSKEYLLVRNLMACETMGGATQICTDKTGTLTQNQMSVVDHVLFTDDDNFLKECVALNSTCFRSPEGRVVGSPSEMALLDFLFPQPDELEKLRAHCCRPALLKIPFSSQTKWMATAFARDEETVIYVVTGAPDVLLSRVEDESVRRSAELEVARMARRGLRTIFVGFTAASSENHLPTTDLPGFLDPLGLFGIQDLLRVEVPRAVEQLLAAGITVRMITGDSIDTAIAVAEECGIKTKSGICMTGQDMEALSDTQLDRMIPQLQVVARSRPSDKRRLVQRLQLMNQIVAVTGDGNNDVPALKEANVGFAMGISGTDVAKLAADIIVMNDNFASIVSSVKWGRNVFEKSRKFLQYQLTVGFASSLVCFICAVSGNGLAFGAIQLLWVNLILNVCAGIGLTLEAPEDHLLMERPHGLTDRILSNRIIKQIGGQTAFQTLLICIVLFWGHLIPFTNGTLIRNGSVHLTLVFNSFVFLQLFNALNCRTVQDKLNVFSNLRGSLMLFGLLFFAAGLQAVIVEFGGVAFKVAPLSWDQWLFCIALGCSCLVVGAVLRLVPVPKRHLVDIVAIVMGAHELTVRPFSKEVAEIGEVLSILLE